MSRFIPKILVKKPDRQDEQLQKDNDRRVQDANNKAQKNNPSKFETQVDALTQTVNNAVMNTQSMYEEMNAFYEANQDAFAAAGSGLLSLSSSEPEVVEGAISTFLDYCPVVMKGLSSLSQLHPFIGVAAQAFSLVLAVNLKRMQNNKKVVALSMQIQDTIMVLFQLRDVRDPDTKDDNGTTVGNRMKTVLDLLAKDITLAGTACDDYMKQGFVSKTLKSFKYEGKLAGFGDTFVKHRQDLVFALNIRTSVGVDNANTKLDRLTLQTENIQFVLADIIARLDTPREKTGKEFIARQGGPRACLQDEHLVMGLIDISGEGIEAINAPRTGDVAKDLEAARKKLFRDYTEELDAALKRNFKVFERKMDMRKKQMEGFIEDSLQNQSSFIISALQGQAHGRVTDPDLQSLWKENGWKGNVKARAFVLALQESFVDRLSAEQASQKQTEAPSAHHSNAASTINLNFEPTIEAVVKDDRWALKYIDVSRVQPILEAIDDDATGYISIREINAFVSFKPEGWSLAVWIAYWASGWHADLVRYKQKIYGVIREMYQVLDYDTFAPLPNGLRNLPANRSSIDEYMNSTMFSRIDLLLRSLQPLESYIGNKMKQSINAFSTPEEARLQINLEGVDYDIDSPETVAIVTGPGRIERFVLPLLYLLLKRHLKVFYLAQTHIIDEEEFRDMTISLKNVFEILDARIKNLSTVLEQAIHDVAGRLSTFAFGLIRLTYIDPTRRPKDSSLRPWNEEGKEEGKGAVVGSEKMSLEAISKIPVSILKYGNKDTLESSIYQHSSTLFHVHDRQPRPPRHRISGYWAGHLWTKNLDELYSDEGLMQVSIIEVNQEGGIAGSAETYHGLMTVSGNISSNGTLRLKFVYEDGTTIECNGQFNIRAHTLSGGFFFTKSDDEDEGGDRNLLGYGSDDSDDDKIREGSDSSDEESNGGSNNGQGTTDAERSKPRNQIGTFIFNRTPAAAWRFHTPFGGTSKSARERWAFAIAAVLDEVKRTNFSMGFIRERNAERKRFLDLLVRRETHHKFNLSPTNCLSNAEGRELRLLTAKIHPADARFYYSLVKSQIEASSVRHLGCLCNNCGRGIIQTKFLCVACINADHSETLDLCVNCRESLPLSDSFKHLPSHSLLKLERVIQDGERAWAIPRAREIAYRVKELFRWRDPLIDRLSADEKSDKTKLLDMEISCCCCGTEVNLPCWVCLSCSPDTFICDTCEFEREPVPLEGPGKPHKHKHILIRVRDAVEVIHDLVEESGRMQAMERKLATVEERLHSFEGRFSALEVMLSRALSTHNE